jgi:hypothetical protein
MNTTTSVLLTAVIVVVGRWARNEGITSRIVIGIVILALFLSLMGQSQPKLAGQFGALILLTAVFGYGPDILKKLGYPVGNLGAKAGL